ncbi:NAD(P)/FAD-dependent oxidoreductase [Pseudonocardia sp. KRD291]|uniref:NAD(P)/FAD-dependent oxidoreductase n=1 Tax=Pseudonocardia sp. KRD291 TaxID=2792007 RepID=UPI001C5C4A4D|nr:NAD(P)/FAD-dependent oxidoreductase [Pseudonocardia sp. KRD291]MBW0105828.1 NAD(P)/FAD-dependent oxidoreductase [Pseudonocardia sp. KRD291]
MSNRIPRVVVLGGGFAGFHAAKNLARRLRGEAEIVLVNSTDYFLYLPLLPQVTSGVLDPRRITVPLAASLPGVQVRLGEVRGVDLDDRTVHYADPEGGRHDLGYDRLVVAIGSVNKLLPIPGVAEHAHGFRGMPEALYLRDHILGELEMATDTDDPVERAARCTFVVVGAGYTGTEVAAQGALLTAQITKDRAELAGQPIRWLLLDVKDRVLPELDAKLSVTASRVLRERGVEVRTGTSVTEATADGVQLSTGESLPTRSLIWCVGVRPDPLVQDLGLPVEGGRIVVDAEMAVRDHPGVYAVGDAAAVPDPADPGSPTPMTAQHAQRHGKAVARNVAASLGHGTPAPYTHRDMGFVVDLGGRDAAANPLHVALPRPLARAVTSGYHLAAMPGNRIRTGAEWLLDKILPRQRVQLGLVRPEAVPLDTASPELPAVDERG